MAALRKRMELLAANLEQQAQDDEDAARQLREKPPAKDEQQSTWRKIEAATLERSARRLRDLAATMRWKCGQREDQDPIQVVQLRRRLRLYKYSLLALLSGYAVLLAWVFLVFCERVGC